MKKYLAEILITMAVAALYSIYETYKASNIDMDDLQDKVARWRANEESIQAALRSIKRLPETPERGGA